MGDIRADLEADLKIAQADVEAARIVAENANKEFSRLRDIRRDITVKLLKLDLYVGSKWELNFTDHYYGSKRRQKVTIVYVDETHLIYLKAGTIPERIGINQFTSKAKKIPDNA